jgi:hypothetical protein
MPILNKVKHATESVNNYHPQVITFCNLAFKLNNLHSGFLDIKPLSLSPAQNLKSRKKKNGAFI